MPGPTDRVFKVSNKYVPDIYRACLSSLLEHRRRVSVVIIGANDGRIADPSYRFLSEHRQRSDVLLIEPQKALIPILAENYKHHPSAKIFNGVISAETNVEFFAIKENEWGRLQPSYAKASDGTQKWPLYRAPSGVSSTIRSNVEKWLENFPDVDSDQMIESYSVRGSALMDVLNECSFPAKIDALQIDVEGADLSVLKLSNIAETKPALIFIETSRIRGGQLHELQDFLCGNDYFLFFSRGNSLAIQPNSIE